MNYVGKCIDDGWKNAPVVRCKINELGTKFKEVSARFSIPDGRYTYELLYIHRPKSKRLIVSFSGGGRTKQPIYPRFLRWKYADALESAFLCIDDPMYSLFPDNPNVMWYLGCKDDNKFAIQEAIKKIVDVICSKLSISPENLIFLGSSGGGTQAIKMANYMPGTKCLAINPQFVLKNWKPEIVDFFTKNGISLEEYDELKLNARSFFCFIENLKSKKDNEEQWQLFAESNKIHKSELGVSLPLTNLLLWCHESEGAPDPHISNPEKALPVLLNLIEHVQKEGRINESDKKYFDCLTVSNMDYWKVQSEKYKAEISIPTSIIPILCSFIKGVDGNFELINSGAKENHVEFSYACIPENVIKLDVFLYKEAYLFRLIIDKKYDTPTKFDTWFDCKTWSKQYCYSFNVSEAGLSNGAIAHFISVFCMAKINRIESL